MPRIPASSQTYVDTKLQSCSHVFIRNNAHTGPLDQPWTGPYPVITRGPKTFVVLRNGNRYTVSVDRLKAAYLLEDFLQQPVVDNTVASGGLDCHREASCSGMTCTRTRRIQPPSYLRDYFS